MAEEAGVSNSAKATNRQVMHEYSQSVLSANVLKHNKFRPSIADDCLPIVKEPSSISFISSSMPTGSLFLRGNVKD